MILRLQNLALLAALLAIPLPTLCGAESLDIPSDTPISSLIASAKAARARGANNDALSYFDAAVARDPSDYLTLFQRGATYLALGRNPQASSDFDSVLKIKPGFEGALLQRAKIKARNGEWAAAKMDYNSAGQKGKDEIAGLEEAEGAAFLATEAEQKQDWEACVQQAGVAIMTAGTSLSLRQLRARCRFERGEIQEGVNDLAHVLQIQPGAVEPHLQMSSMFFYSLGDTERGLAQVKKCLHSDPESKPCKLLFRSEKAVRKTIGKIESAMDARQYNSASKLLVGTGGDEDLGLLDELKNGYATGIESKMIHPTAPNTLYATYVEKACECFREMSSVRRASPYCSEALALNPSSLHGLLQKAQQQMEAEEYEPAIATLNTANEAHPGNHVIQQKLQDAQIKLKRSKQKDYYKVLGISSDADERTIKRAYRTMTKAHHPDKVISRGVPKEEAEKKMAQINEAYEVLSDPELKARFDRGDDPNDPMSQQGGQPFHGSPFGQGGQQFFFQQGGGGGPRQFKFSGGGGGNPFGGFPFG